MYAAYAWFSALTQNNWVSEAWHCRVHSHQDIQQHEGAGCPASHVAEYPMVYTCVHSNVILFKGFISSFLVIMIYPPAFKGQSDWGRLTNSQSWDGRRPHN